MACCPGHRANNAAVSFTRLKPSPAEATSTPAWSTTSSFTEVNVQKNLGDGYWIAAFPFRTVVDDREGPVGPELLGSGLGYEKDGQLVPSQLRMYKNPYHDIKNQTVPPNQWEYTVIKEVNYAIASVYGNFRPKSGLNDIIFCHNYGPSMDNLDEQGGIVSYLVNPGDKNQGNWESKEIGRSPAMHRLLTGRFTQKYEVEVMGFPIIPASGDRENPAPILHWKVATRESDQLNTPKTWTETKPLSGTFRLIHEVYPIHSPGGLDKILVAGREGVSLIWFDPKTQEWRWENLGTGLPQERKPSQNPYWGSGSVAAARVGNDSVGYIASCEAFHGNLVSVYVKPPGTRPDQIVTSEHWRRFVIDDFGPLKEDPEEKDRTGTIHNVTCADLDGSGVDSIIVACMGYPDGKAENMGTYVYRPVDIQKGYFIRYKISNASAGRIVVADFRCSGTWDVATISYSVPNYLETANPAMRIMLNNVKQTRHTIKAQRLGDEVMIRVPRAKLADHISEMPFLDIAGKKLSIVVLPPHKEYILGEAFKYMNRDYAADGVKVINGELSWTEEGGNNVTRGIAVTARQAASMIPKSRIVKAGSNGAIFIRLASSMQTSMPGLKVDDMDDIATINTVPFRTDPAVRDMIFPWVACKDREWGQGGFDWPFYNLVGYHILYDDDSLTNFCHIQAWTLAAFHNHDTKSFCEIHACISNGTGRGGMWWAKNEDGDQHLGSNPTEMDPSKLEQYADSVIVDDMEEHGPLWRMNDDGRPSLRPNDTVDYPYHAWLAGRREADSPSQAFDVWLAFEFPSTEFQTGLSRFNGCAACGSCK
ncbi:hypothetical protein RhiJN_08291 [Ceratobasidium sp. AG-Ba]|nr:hypothetical protein RhiJN_08291 [Ceratobasidium sp. AG-Ba]